MPINLEANGDRLSVNGEDVAYLSDGGGGGVPVGFIGMYSGLLADIPADWLICDGTNGTPDLTDKFVMGTITEGDIGVTGGSNDAMVVSHNHTASASSTFTGNALSNHSHTYSEPNNTGSASTTTGANHGLTVHTGTATSSVSAGTPSGSVSTSVTIDAIGEDGAGKNVPAYVKLAYIMKV